MGIHKAMQNKKTKTFCFVNPHTNISVLDTKEYSITVGSFAEVICSVVQKNIEKYRKKT